MDPNQQQAPVAISPQDLAAAMAQALQQANPPQQQAAPQMSPEQMAQLQKLYSPEQQLHDALFGEGATPEMRMQALASFVDGLRQNWRAEAGLIADHTGQTLYGAINPYLEDAREIAQSRFFDNIYKDHPGLQSYDPFVKQYMSVIEQDPAFPKERDKRAEFARERVVQQIKQFSPQFDPRVAPVQQSSQQQQRPNGGQSIQPSQSLPSFGSGGGSGSAAKAPQAASGTPSFAGDKLGLGF